MWASGTFNGTGAKRGLGYSGFLVEQNIPVLSLKIAFVRFFIKAVGVPI